MKHHLLQTLPSTTLTLLLTAFLTFGCTTSPARFEVDGIYYKVTSPNADSLTVEVTHSKFSPEYSGDINIPSAVEYEGSTYTVTSIGPLVFTGCTGLRSITIPSSVTSIDHGAFYDCTELTIVTISNGVTSIGEDAFRNNRNISAIVSFATTPPACDSNAFNGIDKGSCTLYVPSGTKALYRASNQWKDFHTIVDDIF